MVLVRGLGPQSATVASLQARVVGFGERRVREAGSPEQAEAAFASFFGSGRSGRAN